MRKGEGSVKQSNLERFLARATPTVPWRSSDKTTFQDSSSLWQMDKTDMVDYFTLEDLWEQYKESSAYGLGIPLPLPSGEEVVQYYAPYLSAVQLYTTKALVPPRSRSYESESDSWSDDSTAEKLLESWDALSEGSVDEQSGSLAARGFGLLNFHFVDFSNPYERPPLVDKVYELAQENPCLITLKSAELSPASWISVAWYPICHVPAHRNLKDMSACFLTYHTLSSLFQDTYNWGVEDDGTVGAMGLTHPGDTNTSMSKSIPLSPFGVASYRLQDNLWRNRLSSCDGKISDLYNAASSWLKQLGVHHPDFNFFSTHSI